MTMLVSFGDGMSVQTANSIKRNSLFIDSLQRRIIRVIAIIDDRGGALQVVFWNKEYYHVFISGLQLHGYRLQSMKHTSNILRFQREGSSVIVDVTVWSDIYVLELHN